MNLQQLRLFISIAEAKNITKAANQLFLSQPALSRQLTLLENELGCKLIIRKNHGVDLTPAGEVLYLRSKVFLNDFLSITEAVREATSGVYGLLTIGTINTCLPLVTKIISIFKKKYPNVTFRIAPDIPHRLTDDLDKGNIQFAFLRAPMSNTGNLCYHLFPPEPTCLAIHKDMDPLPESDVIEFEQLQNIPICFSMQNQREYRIWDYGTIIHEECNKRGIKLIRSFECSGSTAGLSLVCAGLAAACIPRDFCKFLKCSDVHLKTIPDIDLSTQPVLLWNNNNYISRPMQLFLEFSASISNALFSRKSGTT